MTYDISEDTRAKTKKCHCDFACLAGGECLKCVVEDSIPNDGCFIKPVKTDKCNYLLSYGNSWLCTCPTRSEIYRRYGK
jgi:hypothetical protein